jgi:SAM-dependent methyltransferase
MTGAIVHGVDRERSSRGRDHPPDGVPRTFISAALQVDIMEKRLDEVFRERTIRDEGFGELRPHALLVEIVSGRMAPRGRALNLHCGMGSDSLYLAQEGYAVAAVGFSPQDVERVSKMAQEARANVIAFTADPSELPFHEGEFDFIADTGCIHRLDEGKRSALLKELHRTLRRGGRLFTVLPSLKDNPRGATRASIEEMFHPSFEIVQVTDAPVEDAGGKAEHLYYYSILVEKA